mmetsp:Transcript_6104/g.16246  ORF Transcript_6104/g.16246 Transcript_6104/m.16246 type:complete len:251 (-) Transcript_6104:286-1038(-)
MSILRRIGASVRRGTEDLSVKLNELPITDVASLQSFIQGKEHPELYAENGQLEVAIGELECARKGLQTLLSAMRKYRDALAAAAKSSKALGEAVSTATASLETEGDDEETTRAQIQLGAAFIVTSGDNEKAASSMCASVEQTASELEQHFKGVVTELKKRYTVKKMEYLRLKSQIAETTNTDAERQEELRAKASLSRTEWQDLSCQLKQEAEQLTAAYASAITAAVRAVGSCRDEILSRNAEMFKIEACD